MGWHGWRRLIRHGQARVQGEASIHQGLGMMERETYIKVMLFLKYTAELVAHSEDQTARIIAWLGVLQQYVETNLSGADKMVASSLSDLLDQHIDKGERRCEQQILLKISRQYLLWGKAMFPAEYKLIRLSWIMNNHHINETGNEEPYE
jgi:hypothetical protein